MEGGDTQMPGFSEGEGVLDRFAIANLANKDYVRGLSQGVLRACWKLRVSMPISR
jgi:hypothetical protein